MVLMNSGCSYRTCQDLILSPFKLPSDEVVATENSFKSPKPVCVAWLWPQS